MNYSLDVNAANEGAQGVHGNYIRSTGAYSGKITLAKKITASTGTIGIEFEFETLNGMSANMLQVWTIKQDGTKLSGFNLVQAIMAVLKLRQITEQSSKVKRYDFDARAEVEENGFIYPDLMKPIGFIMQRELYYNGQGVEKDKVNIFAPFDPKTKQMANEILGQKQAEALDKIMPTIKDYDNRKKQPSNSASFGQPAQPPQPVNPMMSDFDDDIPF